MNSFYSLEELKNIGFKKLGENVLISRKTSIYSPEKISIGSHVRIDDFVILSGEITLGNYIHISAYTALYARYGIELEDYSGISPRCTLFSATDDFSGEWMVGPLISQEYTNVTGGKILIKKYVQIGAGCILLPKIILNEGVAIGAMSLVNKDAEAWTIYAGIPAKPIKIRSKKLIDYIEKL